jgi:hypothetical protein
VRNYGGGYVASGTFSRQFAVRRKARLVSVWLTLIAMSGVLLFSGYELIGDVRGGTADAEVVNITTNVPGRRVYDIRLVTRSGRTCMTEVDSGSNPPPREIRVGGTSRVHYSANNTCVKDSVRESTNSGPLTEVVVASLIITVCLFALGYLRRNPERIP